MSFQKFFKSPIQGAKRANPEVLQPVMDAIAELSAKAGVAAPKLMICDPLPAYQGHLPFIGTVKTHMFMTEDTFRFFNCAKEGNTLLPSEQLRAVIGHELSHVKHATGELIGRYAPLLGLPLVATAGFYLIQRAKKKAREERMDSALEALHTIHPQASLEELTQQAVTSGKLSEEDVAARTMVDTLATAGKYAAVIALSGAAGFVAKNVASRAFEFRADALAAELTSPQAVEAALERSREGINALLEAGKAAGKKNLLEHPAFHWLLSPAPTIDQRITAIRGHGL